MMKWRCSPVVEDGWGAPGDTGGSGSAIPGQDAAAWGRPLQWEEGNAHGMSSVGHGCALLGG